MYIPRWVLLSLMVAVATVSGWALRGVASDHFSSLPVVATGAPTGASDPGAPVNVSMDGAQSAPVINLTIDGLDASQLNEQEPGSATAPPASQVRYGQVTGSVYRQGRGVVAYASGAAGRANGTQAAHGTNGANGSGAGSVIVVNNASDSGSRRDEHEPSVVNHNETLVSNDSRITVNGNEIVVASDGSIVFQGDNGSLNGNTGDSSSSGSIAIDNNGSTISTGTSGGQNVTTPATPPVTTPPAEDVPAAQNVQAAAPDIAAADMAAGRMAAADPVTSEPAAADAMVISGRTTSTQQFRQGADGPDPGSPEARMAADSVDDVSPMQLTAADTAADTAARSTPSPSPLWGWSLGNVGGRSISISGYEDHSVTVDGNDQIILYDDSNVFINRDGQVNANTGDTDSSGLNVVDAVDSIVRSGNSGDGEGAGDDEEEEDEEEDESPVALVGDGAKADRMATQFATTQVASARGATLAAATPLAARSSGSVDDEDTTTTASGDDSLVIGGDGYDDLAIRSTGNRNIVVYDDSNLVIGGTGGVNAQIGDSDTAGAVVMGVRNSIIEAGCEGDLCPLYRPPAG